MTPKRRLHTGLPFGIVLLSLGLLIFGLVRLTTIEKSMRLSLEVNMLWVVGQAEIELLRLDALLARLPPSDPAIAERFDLLASRLHLLEDGPQLRYLEDIGQAQAVAAPSAAVLAFDPNRAPLTEARAAELAQALETLREPLHRSATRAMMFEWEGVSERIETYRGAVTQVILSLALGLAVASYLGWRLVRDQRELLRAEELRLNAVRLEQDLREERAQGAYWRDFAAVVSHQFRTPLAVIDSAAQRIMRRQGTITPTEQSTRLETIRNTVSDLTRLVDAALLSGQIDNDQKVADCARHDLVAPLRLLLRDLGARHPGRSLRLEAQRDPLEAWFDPGLTLHVVMNLLENALRHSSEAVVLRIFEDGGRVACAVVDQGPGIAPGDLEQIFDRFRRGAHAGGDGSGLGLWTARRLAQLQGGAIEVESQLGQGSVFTLWLGARAPVEVAA